MSLVGSKFQRSKIFQVQYNGKKFYGLSLGKQLKKVSFREDNCFMRIKYCYKGYNFLEIIMIKLFVYREINYKVEINRGQKKFG